MNVVQTATLRYRLPLALIGALCLALPARGQTANLNIATANPAKIFNEMTETKALKEKMESDHKALAQEEQERVGALDSLRTQRTNLKPDSPQYADKNKEILQKSIDLQVWRELEKAELQRQQKLQMKTIFEKIETAIADVAQQKGYNLVIAEQRTEFPDDLDQISVEQLRALINQRDILYSSKGVDISDQVINDLNAKYAAATPK